MQRSSVDVWFHKLEDGFEKAQDTIFSAYGELTLFIILGAGSAALLERVADGWPLSAQIAVLTFFGAVLAWLIWSLGQTDRRRLLYRSVASSGRFTGRIQPFLFVIGVQFVALGLFTALTFVLYEGDQSAISTHAGKPVTEVVDVEHLYEWQFFNAVPGLDATDALRWNEPLDHDGAGIGLLILTFRIIAIVVIVQAFVAALRWAQAPGTGATDSEHTTPDRTSDPADASSA